MVSRRFQFDKYHTGPWSYAPENGVAPSMTGNRTDVRDFIEVLEVRSCSPVATRRILDELARPNEVHHHQGKSGFQRHRPRTGSAGGTMAIMPPAEP